MTDLTTRDNGNIRKVLEELANSQNTLIQLIQTKTDKDEERDQKIESISNDIDFFKSERELNTEEFGKLDDRRKAKVYELFGEEKANQNYRGEKVFGYVLRLINRKVRRRARLARPMKSTKIRDFHSVMDAIDEIYISKEEVEDYIDYTLEKRQANNREW